MTDLGKSLRDRAGGLSPQAAARLGLSALIAFAGGVWTRFCRWVAYRKTWRTPIGRDCVSLDDTLAGWLGDRLLFLSEHAHGTPYGKEFAQWKSELRTNGLALKAYGRRYECESFDDELTLAEAGKEAMRWVAEHLEHLWD